MAEPSKTISGEELGRLLAQRGGGPLGDRSLRLIADKGYFPRPIRGGYELTPTIFGLLKYYRELYAKKSGNILEEELRQAVAKRKVMEVAASRAEAEVEETAEVERSRIALVVMIRQKLLALPAKAASYLACCTDERQLVSELEKQITEILTDLEKPAFTARPDSQPQDGPAEQPGPQLLSPPGTA